MSQYIPQGQFTLPRDIAGDAAPAAETAHPPGGVAKSCPAGRGWIPGSRDIGLPVLRDGTSAGSAPPQDERDRGGHGGAGDAAVGLHHPRTPSSKDKGALGSAKGYTDTASNTGTTSSQQHSTFYRERQVRFLECLSVTGNVRAACRSACIAPQTAYRARRASADFALAWDGALVAARAATAEVLADRALNGMEESVFYHGEVVAQRRRYCSRLLLAHLARLDRMAEDIDLADLSRDFDDVLARFAAGEAVCAPRPETAEEWEEAERQALAEAAKEDLRLHQAMEEARYAADPDYDPDGWRAEEEREHAQQRAFVEGHPKWWLVGEEDDADAQEAEKRGDEEREDECSEPQPGVGASQPEECAPSATPPESPPPESPRPAPPSPAPDEPPSVPTHSIFQPVRQGRLPTIPRDPGAPAVFAI